MSTGYRIIVWDQWGEGLVMVNPRFHVEGEDMYGNPRNWWPTPSFNEKEKIDSWDRIVERHKLDSLYFNYDIIFD